VDGIHIWKQGELKEARRSREWITAASGEAFFGAWLDGRREIFAGVDLAQRMTLGARVPFAVEEAGLAGQAFPGEAAEKVHNPVTQGFRSWSAASRRGFALGTLRVHSRIPLPLRMGRNCQSNVGRKQNSMNDTYSTFCRTKGRRRFLSSGYTVSNPNVAAMQVIEAASFANSIIEFVADWCIFLGPYSRDETDFDPVGETGCEFP
jgi:hypothetical protein